MAIILFAANDLPSKYFLGDPIVVVEDTHEFSAIEKLPPDQGGIFFRVQITDRTKAQIDPFITPFIEDAVEGDPEFLAPDPEDRYIYRGRANSKLDLTQLPQALVDDINALGIVSGGVQDFRQALRAKRWDRQAGEAVDDGELIP